MSGSFFYFLYLLLLYLASESATAVSPLPSIWADGCASVQYVVLTAIALITASHQQPDRRLATVDSTKRVVASLAPLASVWLLCLYTLLLAAVGVVPFSSLSPPASFPVSPLVFSAVSVLGYAALLLLPASLCLSLLFHDHTDGETHLSIASFVSLLLGALLSIPILVLLQYQWQLSLISLLLVNPIPTLYSLLLLCFLPLLLLYHRHYHHSLQPYSPMLDVSVNGWGVDGLGSGVGGGANGGSGGGKYGKNGVGKGKGWMSKQYQALLAGSELSVDSEDDEEHVAIF